mmetsp:Transcript_1692/g.3586  ORF Transcript_1692/g.3586 Transcript_1692/m.3586 type:complete len:373 (-) Transcript_1692:1180-2298(-)
MLLTTRLPVSELSVRSECEELTRLLFLSSSSSVSFIVVAAAASASAAAPAPPLSLATSSAPSGLESPPTPQLPLASSSYSSSLSLSSCFGSGTTCGLWLLGSSLLLRYLCCRFSSATMATCHSLTLIAPAPTALLPAAPTADDRAGLAVAEAGPGVPGLPPVGWAEDRAEAPVGVRVEPAAPPAAAAAPSPPPGDAWLADEEEEEEEEVGEVAMESGSRNSKASHPLRESSPCCQCRHHRTSVVRSLVAVKAAAAALWLRCLFRAFKSLNALARVVEEEAVDEDRDRDDMVERYFTLSEPPPPPPVSTVSPPLMLTLPSRFSLTRLPSFGRIHPGNEGGSSRMVADDRFCKTTGKAASEGVGERECDFMISA